MDLLWKDIRFGLRTLVRNPATTAVALLALALGIGANTAIFSVVNGVLLEPLPFAEPEELVMVWETNTGRGMMRVTAAPPNFDDWRRQARSFEGLAATETARFNLTGRERPELLAGASVSAGFFTTLGAPMLLGRDFTAEEDRPGAGRVVVLSEGLWRRLFAADPGILGRAIPLSGEPYTVVGVAPAIVDFPNNSQLWVPLAAPFLPEDRGAHSLRVIGRLKPGVSVERVQAEMSAIAARLARQYPETNEGWGTAVEPLRESIVQNIRPILLILLGAVAFVLLIACANVANLLLARVAAREREIAVRTALGAGRWRLVRQMLTESAVLFLGGGLLGLLLAFWGTRVLVAMSPEGVIPRASAIGLDGRVLLFTFGVALLTGLLFGLVPALHAGGGPLQPALKEGGRGQSGGLRGRWVRNALVLAEVSVALMLLVGAGLLIQSFSRLRAVDPGMRTEGVLTAQVALAEAKYPEPAQQTAFFRQLLERLQAMPGVESAASVFPLPLSGARFVQIIAVEGRPAPPPNEVPVTDVFAASPGYFRTVGVPLLEGRDFTAQDTETSQPVVIINQAAARRLWPGQSPLGQRLTYDDITQPDPEWRTIVGVVGDVRNKDLGEEPGMQSYWPQLQTPVTSAALVVRATDAGNGREPERLAGALRQAVSAADRELPVDQVRSLEEVVSRAISQSRFKTVLLGLFAGLALVLAAVGVYGVISYSVAQRTHEIGIRMALGAHRGQVLRMVVRQGMGLVLAGVVAGLVLAWFAVRLLTDQVYGVSPSDPATFALVPLVLLAVALLANYLPARRATRVDPLEALRYE